MKKASFPAMVTLATLACAMGLLGQATTRPCSNPATAGEETAEQKAKIDKMIKRQIAQDPYFFGDEEFSKLKSPYAVQQLLIKMNDKDQRVRTQVARALGYMRDPCATKALLNMLAAEDEEERFAAIYALGHLGDKLAVAPLLKVLADSSLSAHLRAPAADALGHIGEKESIAGLKEAMKDRDDYVRVCAIRALMAMGDQDGVAAAIDVIKGDLPWGLKIVIVDGCRYHPDTRFKEHLIPLLKENPMMDRAENRMMGKDVAAAIRAIDKLPTTTSAPIAPAK